MPILGREPILWLGVIGAAVTLALRLGLQLPDGVETSIQLFAIAALSWIGRSAVWAPPVNASQVKSYIEAAPKDVLNKAEVKTVVAAVDKGHATTAKLVSFVLVAILLGASPVLAAGELDRFSGGLDAQAQITKADGSQVSAFLPGAYLSYNVLSNMALAAHVGQNMTTDAAHGVGGLRVRLARAGEGELAGGINATYYGDSGRFSWSASLHGHWPLLNRSGRTVLAAIGSAAHDPGEDGPSGEQLYRRTDFRAGLRWQAFGGNE